MCKEPTNQIKIVYWKVLKLHKFIQFVISLSISDNNIIEYLSLYDVSKVAESIKVRIMTGLRDGYGT